jgi:hypothetical protein
MRKIYLSLAAACIASVSFAQSQRLVVFEQFTQASCPPCAAANPPLNAMLDANETKVVSIKYQTSWPGVDPMNAQNPTEVASRVTYYGVTGVPAGRLDGGVGFNGQPSSMTQADIDARYAVPSPLTIDLTHSFSAAFDTIHVHAVITRTGAITSTNLKAHIAVIERNIYFATAPGTNGEKHFEGVMKKMLPNASGTTVSLPNVGDSMVLDYSWKLANIYDNAEIAVVGFVQDNAASTKEVLQGGYSAPLPITLNAGVVPANFAMQCTPNFTPTFDLTNNGLNDITSATINIKYNGGAATPYNWTGLLSAGQTTTITLAPVTISNSGVYTYSATIVDVNGTPDNGTGNNTATYAVPAAVTAVAAPIIQAYTATTWPPADWIINSPDNAKWTRSTAGLNGAGSAKANFYDLQTGQYDMITPKADLTPTAGQTMAALDFDLAHRQYSAAYNDELQVLVSTDCGTTWTQVFSQAGAQLASVTGYVTSAFTPTAAQWKHVWVDMSSYIGNTNVLVNFQGNSAYGNNLYIDNINLHFGSPTGIVDLANGEYLSLYPNPSTGILNVDAKFTTSKSLNVTVTDMLGNVVYTNNYEKSAQQKFTVDLTNQSNGIYFVKFENENGSDIKKINIIK